jgi:hypothetical protein
MKGIDEGAQGSLVDALSGVQGRKESVMNTFSGFEKKPFGAAHNLLPRYNNTHPKPPTEEAFTGASEGLAGPTLVEEKLEKSVQNVLLASSVDKAVAEPVQGTRSDDVAEQTSNNKVTKAVSGEGTDQKPEESTTTQQETDEAVSHEIMIREDVSKP